MPYACIIYLIMGWAASYGNLYARFNVFYQVDMRQL
jgi:hypothetical protein